MPPEKMPSRPVLYLRSAIYWILQILALIPVVFLLLLSFPLSVHTRYKIGVNYARANIFLLKHICKLELEVKGKENIPAGAAIAMAKHQSSYETFALQVILPSQTWVLKKELLRIPIFGWGLAMIEPIAINRAAGRKAVDQMVEQGQVKLDEGRWIIIFPEGTRVNPGKNSRYKLGGAIMASRVDYPVVPIAHNAGEFWPRHSFIKWPGKVTFVIGPAIHGFGRDPDEIINEVKTWIETSMEEISDPARWNR